MSNNYKQVKRALWVVLSVNLSIATLKIIIGSIIQSTAMTADGFHSISDGTSKAVGLLCVSLASRPADRDHPYGHKKYEMLAGLAIAGMLLVIAGKIITDGINRFLNPVIPKISIVSLVLVFASLITNVLVCIFEYLRGKKLKSKILISDSRHARSDIFVSLGLLVTLIGLKAGLPPIIDPITSIVVAGFILYAAFEVFRDNIGVLLDKAVIDNEQVKRVVLGFEQVKDIHNIRSRGSDTEVHIDMHIVTSPDMSVQDSHKLAHLIEARIRAEINDNARITAHIEPFE